MKTLFRVFVLCMFFAGCKKSGNPDDYQQTFVFDIKNHDVILSLKKVHLLTDSVYFEFNTRDQYNCDKYRINFSQQAIDKSVHITLGNIYQEGGFCIYGNYPATAQYKSVRLANGSYKIVVKKNNVEFDGELMVNDQGYTFDWVHDAHAMEINPKSLAR